MKVFKYEVRWGDEYLYGIVFAADELEARKKIYREYQSDGHRANLIVLYEIDGFGISERAVFRGDVQFW